MAYIQKGNPFKQKTSTIATSDISKSDMDLAKRLNKLRFEMGHIYPITEKDRGKYVGQTAQTEQERIELYNIDPSGRGDIKRVPVFSETESGRWEQTSTKPQEISDKQKYAQDIRFIKTAKEAGGETFDKLMSLSNKDLVGFQNEVIRVAKPLIGEEFTLDWKKPIKSAETLSVINEMDLTGFKPYLEKADINTSDIKKIIIAQMNNMPDDDGDGIPNMFDGDTTLGRLKGNILRSGVNTLIEMKLKSLD